MKSLAPALCGAFLKMAPRGAQELKRSVSEKTWVPLAGVAADGDRGEVVAARHSGGGSGHPADQLGVLLDQLGQVVPPVLVDELLVAEQYGVVVIGAPGHVEAVRRAVFDALTREQVGQLAGIGEAINVALQRMDEGGDGQEPLPWRRR
ncbi:hypothetical protein ACWIID_28790 [Streptomyces phaeochromogenes]